ncbi:MAG TPA: DsbA family oxidoreductase [Candidatus Binataceae bacterium]|nr:DsbA family oxidoreductase [Candidatus Binataceae bacterium]
MALEIAMYSDFICPFCYIGFEVIRNLRSEFDIKLQWRGFQIHPEWPAEGIALDKVRSAVDLDARRAAWPRIAALAEAEGLEMKAPTLLANSRAALLLAEFANDQGCGEEFEARVYRAYFNDGANIGDPALLARIAAEAGLDPAAVAEMMKSPHYETRLKDNALEADRRGISGVPTFLIGEYPLVGAQPTPVMRLLLRRVTERLGAR